eukprot:TRINITY_DN11059_c0_g1_i3.p1 TRINITY_DN11059_c0_g1~~TRINITY_DN11059_c0_g1_i3.p1  ORF type:complete len:134 (-),score=20.34 TRINITY_DN11059_c0_g1_i3:121-522(-)
MCIRDSIYHWKIKFFNFEDSDPLGQDLKKMKKQYILLHAVFPPSYPYDPPFIRVIRPRFQYRTGHVTVGGSICMELLARIGWSPANSMESVILTVRSQFLAGGARLDFHSKSDYTENEAKMAYDRMVREHGWG